MWRARHCSNPSTRSQSLTITAVRRIISRTQSYPARAVCVVRIRAGQRVAAVSCADQRHSHLRGGSHAGGYLSGYQGFSTRTGVRTFEAAAYLRRAGAESSDVKRLFQSSFDQYMERQKLISSAHATAVRVLSCHHWRGGGPHCGAQAADELLSIIGTHASVVAFRSGNDMAVSARAAGHVNVQLLMETRRRRQPFGGRCTAEEYHAGGGRQADHGCHSRLLRRSADREAGRQQITVCRKRRFTTAVIRPKSRRSCSPHSI